MTEYRYNLITDEWVILADQRHGRPSDFGRSEGNGTSAGDPDCPFCPGNESRTPPETFALRPPDSPADGAGWLVRVVPNKYPALSQSCPHGREPNLAAWRADGFGRHEVIIESPRHDVWIGHHDPEQAVRVVRTLRDRYRHHAATFLLNPAGSPAGREPAGPSAGLVTIFYNHGITSGASLSHPHFQLLVQSVVPPRLAARRAHADRYLREHRRSVFSAVLDWELSQGERICFTDDHFVVFCPYASRSPFEMLVVPRGDQEHFGQVPDGEIASLAGILQKALRHLDNALGRPDYNLVIHTAPFTSDRESPVSSSPDAARWYMQICPRLSTPGGMELATDVYINTVAPEYAAAMLRSGAGKPS
ncbi:MAG: hypothetical protein JW810_10045 [Sedimentisphaerales bacterium]|nr:hypothetical protein [Sedimentisphaerales bacterium]